MHPKRATQFFFLLCFVFTHEILCAGIGMLHSSSAIRGKLETRTFDRHRIYNCCLLFVQSIWIELYNNVCHFYNDYCYYCSNCIYVRINRVIDGRACVYVMYI